MGEVLAKLRNMLTTRRALVIVVGLMLALAWAVPSIGASTAKLARLALGRANQAVYDSKLAVSNSDAAKSTANSANATAGAANNTANTANTTANSAKATANQALSVANAAAHVQFNLTKTVDAGNLAAASCESSPFTQLGVLSTDEAIVTPPSAQPTGVIAQVTTSANQFTLVLCNVTNSPVDPPSGSYEFSILR